MNLYWPYNLSMIIVRQIHYIPWIWDWSAIHVLQMVGSSTTRCSNKVKAFPILRIIAVLWLNSCAKDFSQN